MTNTSTVTLSEVYVSTYDIKSGKLINSVKTNTLSKLQTILNELDITDRNVYLRALRLIRNGATLIEAITAVAKEKHPLYNAL